VARTGRPRNYSEDEVVEAAKELFWSRGYDSSSVHDLVAQLGLPRASLYATFGDKEGLFLRALQCYVDQARDGLLGIGQDGHVLPQLRQAFLDIISGADGGRPRGCFLGNTTAERLPAAEALEQLVVQGFADMESAFTVIAERARANGEVPSDADPAVLGQVLLALFEGMQILAKASPDPVRLTPVLDYALAAVRGGG
jgi:TetR/AcrR family transcriptional repressor of nem operon